jgi:hypothetical protein
LHSHSHSHSHSLSPFYSHSLLDDTPIYTPNILSLTYTRTCTRTRTHSHTLSLPIPLPLSYSHAYSPPLTHLRTHIPFSLKHTHPHNSHTPSPSLPHSLLILTVGAISFPQHTAIIRILSTFIPVYSYRPNASLPYPSYRSALLIQSLVTNQYSPLLVASTSIVAHDKAALPPRQLPYKRLHWLLALLASSSASSFRVLRLPPLPFHQSERAELLLGPSSRILRWCFHQVSSPVANTCALPVHLLTNTPTRLAAGKSRIDTPCGSPPGSFLSHIRQLISTPSLRYYCHPPSILLRF